MCEQRHLKPLLDPRRRQTVAAAAAAVAMVQTAVSLSFGAHRTPPGSPVPVKGQWVLARLVSGCRRHTPAASHAVVAPGSVKPQEHSGTKGLQTSGHVCTLLPLIPSTAVTDP